jgi:hypothetical protein
LQLNRGRIGSDKRVRHETPLDKKPGAHFKDKTLEIWHLDYVEWPDLRSVTRPHLDFSASWANVSGAVSQ